MKCKPSVMFFLSVLICTLFLSFEFRNAPLKLSRKDAENVYGTWTGIALDDTIADDVDLPPLHNSFLLLGYRECKKADNSDCKYCVGASYPIPCSAGVVCGTQHMQDFAPRPGGGGDYSRDRNPQNTYCSKTLCNGQILYCGQGVIRYVCG